MLPKKLFVVDHLADTPNVQVVRAVVIAPDAEAALGQLQAHVDQLNRYGRKQGWAVAVFLRTKARVLPFADAVRTTPRGVERGVVCVETAAVPASYLTAARAGPPLARSRG